MHPESLRRILTGLLTAALLVLLAILGFWPAGRRAAVGLVEPLLRLGGGVSDAVYRTARRVVPTGDSDRQRLARQEERIHLLELKLQTAQNALSENRELRELLALELHPGWTRIAAPVLTRDPASWNRRFTIGRGSDHGIVQGAVVMAGMDVIGRVSELMPKTAHVITIADPRCRLSVRLPERDATGILVGRLAEKWHGVPLCGIDFLPRDRAYETGDTVVTSGLGGGIPAGLRIGNLIPGEDGEATRIIQSSYARALMRPTASFRSFHHVAVICPGRGRTARGERP